MDDAAYRAYSTAKFERICRQVDRAARVLARMRIFGRNADEEAADCDVRSACRSAVAAMAAVLERDGVRLQLELPADPLPAAVPQAMLDQAIAGLLSNAHEALISSAPGDRKIVVEASRVKDRVVVRVADNGPGIAPENRERVFEPFFSTKPNATHLGLGLSLAFGVVHDAGGRLSLLAHGDGAVFQIELPVESPEAGTGVEPVASPHSVVRTASIS
jgi:C4-dicarboxylate-specific signal transduction histidine kinase